MKTLEINKTALLITLEEEEAVKYFPKGEFDLSDQRSRLALREMLCDVSQKTGRDLSGKVEINAFGNRKVGFNIFCTEKSREDT